MHPAWRRPRGLRLPGPFCAAEKRAVRAVFRNGMSRSRVETFSSQRNGTFPSRTGGRGFPLWERAGAAARLAAERGRQVDGIAAPAHDEARRVSPLLLRDQPVESLPVFDQRSIHRHDQIAGCETGAFSDGLLLDGDDLEALAAVG